MESVVSAVIDQCGCTNWNEHREVHLPSTKFNLPNVTNQYVSGITKEHISFISFYLVCSLEKGENIMRKNC